jgi:hypothetical protein
MMQGLRRQVFSNGTIQRRPEFRDGKLPMKMLIIASALGATVAATQPVAQPLQPLQQRNLSRAQARDRADQLFERFDLNHDGYVTRGEAQLLGGKLLLLRASTGRDLAPGIGGHTMRFLKHRFAGVEAATRQQFEAAFLAHFDQMDVNRDGILTAAERKRAR